MEMDRNTQDSNHTATDEEKLRALVLEDMPTDAELMIRELNKAGIVHIARLVDTEDAFIKQLEEFKPDIVLSDYAMPGFDGMQALELVLERYPATPFIIVTGSMNEEVAVECMKKGGADYVIKEHIGPVGAGGEISAGRPTTQEGKSKDGIGLASSGPGMADHVRYHQRRCLSP